MWQREAVGRIARNLVVSGLVGLMAWQLYTHLILKDGTVKLKGRLLSILLPSSILCTLTILKVALIRTASGLYWLFTALCALLFQGMLVCKVDYSATFAWSSALLPVYSFLAMSAITVVLSVYQACFPPDKDPQFVNLPPLVLSLIAVSLSALSLSHIEKVLFEPGDRRELAGYILLTFVVIAAALSIQTGQMVLDVVWGHVEMDFIHSKNPVGLARSRSV